MNTKKAFVFSIDAFVAFSLALVALYSLVFFSAIPHVYYFSLMQAHDLAKDSLYSLSSVPGPEDSSSDSALGYLLAYGNEGVAEQYLTQLIPNEFGYILEKEEGSSWEIIATTQNDPDHFYYKKLKAVSYLVYYGYEQKEITENPYGYNTCSGSKKPCPTESSYDAGEFKINLVRLTVYA